MHTPGKHIQTMQHVNVITVDMHTDLQANAIVVAMDTDLCRPTVRQPWDKLQMYILGNTHKQNKAIPYLYSLAHPIPCF